ncbi:uncharacterized protein LOC143244216 isoform X2 [Tachypleus tridentatus]|uniref:uncharacterized protein LOC143244216 isoform X2 n=1 Tax=Tachypleus tridentatus TaxID=6853 RepID=UPI003FD1F569
MVTKVCPFINITCFYYPRNSSSYSWAIKPVRPKGPQEKSVTVEGVYCNTRFMHSAASLVGCIVQVQTKDGGMTEGVFKTFSPKMELVLEMPYKVDKKAAKVSSNHNLDPTLSSFINNFNAQDYAPEKLIFSLEDVVLVNALNIDLDYATKGFTDCSIIKFSGQVLERELKPWEGPPEVTDGTGSLESNEETKNGWNPNEMFKTNAEKYGVTSTYDSTLQGYTVPLERKNTEEYKKQEAKAVKIALEIENNQQHHTRTALENGDEEERYSSVIRPTENIHNCTNRYVPPQRRRNIPGGKPARNVTQQNFSKSTHHGGTPVYSHNNSRFIASISSPAVPTVVPLNHDYNKPPLTSQTPVIPAQQRPTSPHHVARSQEPKKIRVNGNEVSQLKCRTEDSDVLTGNTPTASYNSVNSITVSQSVTSTTKPCEKKKDLEKNGGTQKGRDEQLAELKRFSSNFRLLEEQPKEQRIQYRESAKERTQAVAAVPEPRNVIKEVNGKEMKKAKETTTTSAEPATRSLSDAVLEKTRFSPNSKDFTLNPNAKSFTPRTPLSAATSPAPTTVQHNGMQTHSPVAALPPHSVVPVMAQPPIHMKPQYLIPSPGSISVTPPCLPTAGAHQAPKFRKPFPVTVQLRPEFSPSVQVAAATGQPILAPAGIASPPQLTMPYSSPGMVAGGGPPQPGIPYAPIYSVFGPRMVSSQPVGMAPTSHTISYAEYQQMTGHLFMSPHMGTAMGPSPHGVPLNPVQNMIPQPSSGPHSAPSTPQSQTPGTPLHIPSPVHQPPLAGTHVTPSQTPTGHPGPTHTPQPVIYSHMLPQPSIQPRTHNHATSQGPHTNQNHPPPNHSSFSGTPHPQPMIFMPHNFHTPHHPMASPGPLAIHGHPIHRHNPRTHVGTPTHVFSHMPLTVFPTGGNIGPSSNQMVSASVIGHPQGSNQGHHTPGPAYLHSH